jgi:hypothetical protein
MCRDQSKNKKAFTWGGSPLCKAANFPPHQFYAVNRLPIPQALLATTPSSNITLYPICTHVTHLTWQKTTWTHWILLKSRIGQILSVTR